MKINPLQILQNQSLTRISLSDRGTGVCSETLRNWLIQSIEPYLSSNNETDDNRTKVFFIKNPFSIHN